jgi:hypothetical protein
LAIPNLSFAEHRISKSDLPVVVSKTADAQSAGTIVVGYAKDVKKGKTEYEVQLMVDGHTKDVTIDTQGNIFEVEEQVQQSALPANVLRAAGWERQHQEDRILDEARSWPMKLRRSPKNGTGRFRWVPMARSSTTRNDVCS